MPSSRLVAIHQPNFFPWLGYFHKIAAADVLVLLDDAQFPKKGGTWSNRVRILVSGAPTWITAPVERNYHGTREIREMRLDSSRDWRTRVLKTLHSAYRRAPGFSETMDLIEPLVQNPTPSLAQYNETALRGLIGHLGLTGTEIVVASSIGVGTTGTQRLIDLVRAVRGSAYLEGGGAEGYQDDDAFEREGIALVKQHFRHPAYEQPRDQFVPGLSTIDALMNCGAESLKSLLAGSVTAAASDR